MKAEKDWRRRQRGSKAHDERGAVKSTTKQGEPWVNRSEVYKAPIFGVFRLFRFLSFARVSDRISCLLGTRLCLRSYQSSKQASKQLVGIMMYNLDLITYLP